MPTHTAVASYIWAAVELHIARLAARLAHGQGLQGCLGRGTHLHKKLQQLPSRSAAMPFLAAGSRAAMHV